MNDEPFAMVVFDQEEAVVQEEEHHAYLIASLVSSWYEICKSSFESTAIEGIRPTYPTGYRLICSSKMIPKYKMTST